jgi:hypothetical protein
MMRIWHLVFFIHLEEHSGGVPEYQIHVDIETYIPQL